MNTTKKETLPADAPAAAEVTHDVTSRANGKHPASEARKPRRGKKRVDPKVTVEESDSREKLVRDSFTMPQADFDLFATLKARAIEFKRPAKKSELVRAGLQVLAGMSDAALRKRLDALAPLSPGRPKKVR